MGKKFYPPSKRCGTTCLGQCCQIMPGCTTPRDIKKLYPADTLIESLRLALESGKFAIDWWEGKTLKYFVRPATKPSYLVGKNQKSWMIYDPSWGGPCVFWTKEKGCELSFEVRPQNCKVVKPGPKGECSTGYKQHPKLVSAKAWKRYIDLSDLIFCTRDNFKVEVEDESKVSIAVS